MSEDQNEMDLNFHTDIPVGEILRRTRSHYGQSLFQIEQVLRIRASQLEALEKGEIDKLPGRVYAIGFVRAYSEYLGLDGDKMVHLFKEQSVGRKQKRPELQFPAAPSESKTPNLGIILSSVIGLLVLIGFVSFVIFPEGKMTEIPAVPEEMTTSQLNEAPALVQSSATATPADAQTADVATAAPAEPVAAKPETRVTLEITEPSWVEIRNAEGAAILRQVLKVGDIYLVPDEPGLILSTGNAGGITVKVDGVAIPPIGTSGAIKRNVALDPVSLKNMPAVQVEQPSPPPRAEPQPQQQPRQAPIFRNQ